MMLPLLLQSLMSGTQLLTLLALQVQREQHNLLRLPALLTATSSPPIQLLPTALELATMKPPPSKPSIRLSAAFNLVMSTSRSPPQLKPSSPEPLPPLHSLHL